MKPLIGITCNYSPDSTVGIITAFGLAGQHWHMLANEYIRAIEKIGGIPVIIPVCDDIQTMMDIVERLDGLLISGGNDVDPYLYGELITKEVTNLSPQRDQIEMNTVRYAMEKSNIPILGICRGIQLINVAFGGSIHQDLRKNGYREHFLSSVPINHFVHSVSLAENSRIHQIIGSTSLRVNSFHHQAVNRVANDFVATAFSEDGVIEAIELPGDRYVLGVQWHPEMLFDCEINQQILKAFVSACKETGENSRSID